MAHDAHEFTWCSKKDRDAPLPPLLSGHRSIQRSNFPHWGKQEHGNGSIDADPVSGWWKPKRAAGGAGVSQTDRDCGGGGQTHRRTDRPARLRLPPQLRQETSVGSESRVTFSRIWLGGLLLCSGAVEYLVFSSHDTGRRRSTLSIKKKMLKPLLVWK